MDKLIILKQIPKEQFLHSEIPEEVILAIFCDFGEDQPEKVVLVVARVFSGKNCPAHRGQRSTIDRNITRFLAGAGANGRGGHEYFASLQGALSLI